MPTIHREETVSHSAEQMYALVNDIESYPEFLTWCSSTEVLSRDEDEIHATITVAKAGVHKSFTTLNRLQKNKMIEIRLVHGPFKHLEGFWLFEESEDGSVCHVTVDLEFEFAGGLLDFAFGPVFQQVAASFVETFCQRARDIYGSSS